MRLPVAMYLVAIIAASTVACGDSKDPTAPAASVAGPYARQKIDGVSINVGTLELDPRGHYNSTFVSTLILDGAAIMGNTGNKPYVFRR